MCVVVRGTPMVLIRPGPGQAAIGMRAVSAGMYNQKAVPLHCSMSTVIIVGGIF
jgi:hypothetical protein